MKLATPTPPADAPPVHCRTPQYTGGALCPVCLDLVPYRLVVALRRSPKLCRVRCAVRIVRELRRLHAARGRN